jgi:tetratricopeptide (TPR) repeat protein
MPTSIESAKSRVAPAIAVGLLVLFLFLIWTAGRAGFSTLLSSYAARSRSAAAADAAVSLALGDTEAHYLRGAILEAGNDLPGAITEYKEAAARRPADYVLWLSLARAHELNGDPNNALAAAREAVQLAPFYAQPHWQLGNMLVRSGQQDAGFNELRLAGGADPTLLPAIVDLAWQLSHGNTAVVIQTIQPKTLDAYRALAACFKKRGAVMEAISMLRLAGVDAEPDRQSYLKETLAAKRFTEAYALWAIGQPVNSRDPLGVLIDPGFEQERNLDEIGFGWRASKVASIALSLDTNNPKAGHSSFRVDFSGDSDPATEIISQLVLVAPNTHYQLRLFARSEELISGALPRLVVIDATSKETLGQTTAFAHPASGWQDYAIDFTTRELTTAVEITLQREPCIKSPCPIFGRLWLDDFTMGTKG